MVNLFFQKHSKDAVSTSNPLRSDTLDIEGDTDSTTSWARTDTADQSTCADTTSIDNSLSSISHSEIVGLIDDGWDDVIEVARQGARAAGLPTPDASPGEPCHSQPLYDEEQIRHGSPEQNHDSDSSIDDFEPVLPGFAWPEEPMEAPSTLIVVKCFLGTQHATSSLATLFTALRSLPAAERPTWPDVVHQNIQILSDIVLPPTKAEHESHEPKDSPPSRACPPHCVIIERSRLRELEAAAVKEGQVVLSQADHAALVDACKPNDIGAEKSAKRKTGNQAGKRAAKSEGKQAQWAGRFTRLDLEILKDKCPPGIQEMFTKSTEDNLGTELPKLASTSATSSRSLGRPRRRNATPRRSTNVTADGVKESVLAERMLYLHHFDAVSAVRILLTIFFFIHTYSSDRARFARDQPTFLAMVASSTAPRNEVRRGKRSGLPKLFEKDMERMYTQFVEQCKALVMTQAEFAEKVRGWRRDGGFYVFIASRLGLGSLLWLSHLIEPGSMWGMNYGEEMELALTHLADIDLPQLCESSGANECARGMMEALLTGFE
ncbi:hypothetical protein FB567DRAFT_598379 [Paraphoma chrysanthemicola]|uniref:Uncharacterized protein n=1 Tax=Paraphoma chrysanthemicola TaxID=798071 RepID=A0A8K0QU45_9PLEO|nr:hypothetical protein FB567DRAFT_598379 [Paraphoma chrysanthemicola]